MKFFIVLLFLLCLPFYGFSQKEIENKAFDSIYYHVAVNVSSSDPSKALYMADSLYVYAANTKHRLKVLMLKADILEKQEKRGEAIQNALKALEIAKENNDFSFQARIYGFLSSQYRNIGFLDKGKESIINGLAVSSKIENKVSVTKYRAMANQELAEYALEENNYEKAIEYLNLSMLGYEQEENTQLKYFFLGNINEIYGRTYVKLNDVSKALKHFGLANSNINKADAGNTIWAALIYQEYSQLFLETKTIDSANFYILKALKIVENSNNGSLRESIYKTTSNYYRQIKEMDSFSKYDSQFNLILKNNTVKKKAMINNAYQSLNILPAESTSKKNYLYILLGFGLVSILGLFILVKNKIIFTSFKSASQHSDSTSSDISISEKTELEIQEKLKEFEESHKFLDKDMSMSSLIGLLNTNSKYLRQILKKYKNSDYTHYINELRINYIVGKLKTDEAYLNYKISYLAEECGFSSHSKFSAIFRDVTNVSPSDFIVSLKNSNS